MGILLRLAKLRAYWAFLTGLVTLVIIPVTRWALRGRKEKQVKAEQKKGVVDAEFEEIRSGEDR